MLNQDGQNPVPLVEELFKIILDHQTAKVKKTESDQTLLNRNYPNPFNQRTVIEYGLLDDSDVSSKVYNILGKEIKTLVDSHQTAGAQSVAWDGKDELGHAVSSGHYIYQLAYGDKLQSRTALFV